LLVSSSEINSGRNCRGGSKSNTTTQDALDYLRKVKKAFEKTPDLYAKFLEIMKEFKSSKYIFVPY
jgi:histone deacetylase complex regulatory component SIN3